MSSRIIASCDSIITMSRLWLVVLMMAATCSVSSSAFVVVPTTTTTTSRATRRVSSSLSASDTLDSDNAHDHHAATSRRAFGRHLVTSVFTGSLAFSQLPQVSRAGLLDEFGTDPTKISQQPSKPTTASTPLPTTTEQKGERGIDPTLRSSYYYPTAKKRYLPRIQKVTEQMPDVTNTLLARSENDNDDSTVDWVTVESFTKTTAENAILPLQLYVSSLDGQGLGMANAYAKTMKAEALEYERLHKLLVKAVQKKDRKKALDAITDMGVAIANYRQTGRLKDDDGNIPSVDEMKRMAMRKPTLAAGSMAPTR